MEDQPQRTGTAPLDLLRAARTYLADVVDVALSAGAISPEELNQLKQLIYIGPDRSGWPRADASHLELEAEMVFLLARRLGARVESFAAAVPDVTDKLRRQSRRGSAL